MISTRTILPIDPSGQGPLEREGQGKHYRGQYGSGRGIATRAAICRVADRQDVEEGEGNQGGQKEPFKKGLHISIRATKGKPVAVLKVQPAVHDAENDDGNGNRVKTKANSAAFHNRRL